MTATRQTIYIEVTVLKPDNAVQLTQREMLAVPCNYLKCQEAEKRMLIIEYSPGSELATPERLVAVHLKAYAREYTILNYTVLEGFVPQLPPRS
jgi:hypothetical protein